MKGIILAGGSGSRLWNVTKAVSKQLLPIYNKPMIMYPLSTLMLAGIRDILVITTPEDQPNFKRLLEDGSQFGINLTYAVQPKPEGLAQAFLIAEEYDFLHEGEPCALILGDNIFYSAGFTEMLDTAKKWASSEGRRITRDLRVPKMATIFGIGVKDPQRYGIAEIDEFGNVLSIEEKPKEPKSDICVTGLYFYPGDVLEKAKQVKPSARGELEITTLNQMYLGENRLRLEKLPRAAVWLDTGTFDSLYEASSFVETIEKRSGTMVCCPEEIAYVNRWITEDRLLIEAKKLEKNEYGQYLKGLCTEK
jgi:glucose-1-phosphate thymidylyltransferase